MYRPSVVRSSLNCEVHDVLTRPTRARLLVLPWALLLALTLTEPSLATIHAGDSVFVKVWNHPELSKQVTVDADGDVRVPLSGVVAIGGVDETVAATRLSAALRPYVIDPAVSVETLAQGTSLFVSGGPVGILKYEPGETLQAAIADEMEQARSAPESLNDSGQSLTKSEDANVALRSRLDLQAVTVERDNKSLGQFDTVALSAKGESGPQLEPGDTIVLRYKPVQVRVLGDVGQPGLTYLSSDQSLSEAISEAGGLLPTSSNDVVLQRDGQTHSLALGDPLFTAPAQNGDVVTIPQAPRVNVIGTVEKPGIVALRSDSSLLSALYTAGGPIKTSNLKDVQVIHSGSTVVYDVTRLTHGDMSQNPQLQDGDTVVVPQGSTFDWSGVWTVLGGLAAGLVSRIP